MEYLILIEDTNLSNKIELERNQMTQKLMTKNKANHSTNPSAGPDHLEEEKTPMIDHLEEEEIPSIESIWLNK